ncbi:MAG TPA: lysylphosphatidylglycerol synthase transmembrane domain-containing protein [Acidimicrobiia bacterium]
MSQAPVSTSPSPPLDVAPAKRRVARRVTVVLLGVAVLVGLVGLTGELGPALHGVAAADLAVAAIAAACQVVRYVLVGHLVRRLAAGRGLNRGIAVRAGLIAVGLGAILPAAPLEGLVLAARELERHGVSRRRTVTALALTQWYSTRGLLAIAVPGSIVLGALAAAHARVAWSSVLLSAAFVLAVVFVAMGVVASRPRLHDRLGRLFGRIPGLRARGDRIAAWWATWTSEVRASVGARRDRARLLATSIAATAFDASCFVVAFRAAHVHADLRMLVLAYVVAMSATFVPLLPGGIGLGEAAVAAFLHASGVPVAESLAGMLVYRALATVMPALAGAGALGELRLRRFVRRSAASGASGTGPQAADA